MTRATWRTRLGFVLAAVGSAVGLGNIWRFPWLTATNGGAAFLLLYVVVILLVGVPVSPAVAATLAVAVVVGAALATRYGAGPTRG